MNATYKYRCLKQNLIGLKTAILQYVMENKDSESDKDIYYDSNEESNCQPSSKDYFQSQLNPQMHAETQDIPDSFQYTQDLDLLISNCNEQVQNNHKGVENQNSDPFKYQPKFHRSLKDLEGRKRMNNENSHGRQQSSMAESDLDEQLNTIIKNENEENLDESIQWDNLIQESSLNHSENKAVANFEETPQPYLLHPSQHQTSFADQFPQTIIQDDQQSNPCENSFEEEIRKVKSFFKRKEKVNYIDKRIQQFKILRKKYVTSSSAFFESDFQNKKDWLEEAFDEGVGKQRKRCVLTSKMFHTVINKLNGFQMVGREVSKIDLREMSAELGIDLPNLSKLYSQWSKDPSLQLRNNHSIHQHQQFPHNYTSTNQHQLEEDTRYPNIHDDFKSTLPTRAKYTHQEHLKKLKSFHQRKLRKMTILEKNSFMTIELRLKYCEYYRKMQKKQAQFYYLDECSFDSTMLKKRVYIRKTAPKKVIEDEMGEFSLLALFGSGGLNFWKIIAKSEKKYESISDIEDLYVKIKIEEEEKQERDNKKYLILDNCIQKDQKSHSLETMFAMKILYLPPLSPQLNPIQLWFADIKNKLKKFEATTGGQRELLELVHKILLDYQNFDFSLYDKETGKYLTRGEKKERF